MKTITSIESFEKIDQDGDDALYECRLVCGCLERQRYRDLEPHVGGWAECSYGIVDDYTSECCTDDERETLKRALHDRSQPSLQKALAALLYAYRVERMRCEELVRKPHHPPRPYPPKLPPRMR